MIDTPNLESCQSVVRRLWPDAYSVHGAGCWAVIAYCRVTTIDIFETEEEAERWLEQIACAGGGACGGMCICDHELVRLDNLRLPQQRHRSVAVRRGIGA